LQRALALVSRCTHLRTLMNVRKGSKVLVFVDVDQNLVFV
jgi:hypothetical protein